MDLMEYMGSVAAAQYTWGAGILWLAVRTDLMGFRGSVAAAQYTWDAWVSWLPVRTFLWVAIKRWLPGSHFLVGLQIDHGYGSALILWVAGIIWLLGSQSSIGLYERFGCCRNVTLGFIIAMAAGSHFFVGLQVDHGCSHHFYGLHKVSGWRFARLLWGTDLIWLPVRNFSMGCNNPMAAGSHGSSGLQWIRGYGRTVFMGCNISTAGGSQLSNGLHERFGCCRIFSMGYKA